MKNKIVKFAIEADISDLPALGTGFLGEEFNTKTLVKMALANYRLHSIENLKNTGKHDAVQLKKLYDEQHTFLNRLADSIKGGD